MRWLPTTASAPPTKELPMTSNPPVSDRTVIDADDLHTQAKNLRLHGLLAHWPEVMAEPESARRIAQWLGWETAERGRRSLERRLREAHIGRFKPLADFDWNWPAQ